MIRIILLALTTLTACAPAYIPNVRNSPMFTKANEFQAAVQFGNGIDAQSAFAFSDHFGVIANFSYINQTNTESEDEYLRHKLFEGGVGYFVNREDSFFEVYAGYGRGSSSTFDSFDFFGSQTIAATGRYERYFLQPAFGKNQGEFNFSFVPRFSMVDFYEFANEVNRTPIYEKPKFFFEPALIGRVNFARDKMYFTIQGGVSLGMSQEIYFDRRTFQIAGGLGLRLGAMKQLVNRL